MTLEYIRKIDIQSKKRLKEDVDGPCNVCICDLLKEPDEPGFMGSIKRGVRCIHGILGKDEDAGTSKGKGKGKKGAKGKKPTPDKKGKGAAGKKAKGGKGGGSSHSSKTSNKSAKGGKGAKGKGAKK